MAAKLILTLLAAAAAPALSAKADSPNTSTNPVIDNANHIFNTIHSGMRQWGSSLNHNGMSYFIATVPAGTKLFHGAGKKDAVEGPEWLAFEPEHALMFARQRGPRHPPGESPGGPPGGGPGGRPPNGEDPGRGPPGGGPSGGGPPGEGPPGGPPPPFDAVFNMGGDSQRLLSPPHPGASNQAPPPGWEQPSPGWLHTFSAKKDLRLLYVDGMSAGKTNNGTLDTQDLVLLGWNYTTAPFNEFGRATGLCELAQTEWDNQIQGILRMEAGFEIILCDFTTNLDETRVTRVESSDGGMNNQAAAGFAYWRAITDRYHGIGGDRVHIDFEHFVSAYSYDVDLFENSSNGMPRLKSASNSTLEAIRSAVADLALSNYASSYNWQGVTDLIVTRFASRIQYFTLPSISSNASVLRSEVDLTLRPFIDYDTRDNAAEIDRCTHHFLPIPSAAAPDSLPAIAVTEVSRTLCRSLLAILDDDDPKARLDDLIAYLAWPVWKECRGCAYDEVCVVPIWPWGAPEDHERPSCANQTAIGGRHGYWGMPRFGGPRPNASAEPVF